MVAILVFVAYAENNGNNNLHYRKVHSDFTDVMVITTLSVVIKEDYYYCYVPVCKDTNKQSKQAPRSKSRLSGIREITTGDKIRNKRLICADETDSSS